MGESGLPRYITSTRKRCNCAKRGAGETYRHQNHKH